MKPKRFAVLGQLNFWILLFSRFTSSIGDWILIFYIINWSEEKTGSPLLGSLIFGVKLASTFMEIAAGVVADRINRRLLMVASDFIRSLLIAALLFLGALGETWLLIVIVALFTIVGAFYSAASLAIVPQVIKPEYLLVANGLFSASLVSTLAIGPPATALLSSFLSFKQLLVLLVAMFVASGVVIFFLKETKTVELKARARFFKEMKEGFTYLLKSSKLKGIVPAILPTALGVAPLLVLVPSLIKEIGLGNDWSSRIYALLGGGMLIGFVVMTLVGNYLSVGKIIGIGLLLSGGSVVYVSTASNLWIIVPVILAGVGMIMTYASIMTILQTLVPDTLMGRVSMSLFGVGALIGVVSTGLFGLLAHWLGIRTALTIAGSLIIIGAVIFYTKMPKAIRDAKVHRLTKLKSNSV